MKEFTPYSKKKCKKIILDSVRDDKSIIRKTLIYGIIFAIIGLLITLSEMLSKESSMNSTQKVIFVTISIPASYIICFFIVGSKRILMNIQIKDALINRFVYDKVAIDESTNKIAFHKKKTVIIDFDTIESITFLGYNEKLILTKLLLIDSYIEIKVDVIKIKTEDKDYHVIVDTIQNSEEFIETLNSIKEIKRPSEDSK